MWIRHFRPCQIPARRTSSPRLRRHPPSSAIRIVLLDIRRGVRNVSWSHRQLAIVVRVTRPPPRAQSLSSYVTHYTDNDADCSEPNMASPTWSSEVAPRPATKRFHPSHLRPLEACRRPWTWWCNDATAVGDDDCSHARNDTPAARLCLRRTGCCVVETPLREKTRSSAIAEGPRDASCQLKSCQLPRNSAETTYTTSPDQIDGMKVEI